MTLFRQSDGKDCAVDRLWSLLGDHNTFMLTTHTDRGGSDRLRARPMAGYPRRDERRIWFLAHREGLKDDEIERNPHVGVTFADLSRQHYVSLSGNAGIEDDVDRKRELWSIAAQAWFPNGPEDEEVILIRVDLDKAEIWDGEASSIVMGVKMASAVAEGEQVEAGTNETIDLRTPRRAALTGE